MTARETDPFTIEIVRDALIATGDEMFVTTQRTSQTPLVYEVLDFAVGLTDPEGRMITHGNGIPLFLGTIGPSVVTLLEKYGVEEMADGDIFATNDPYRGGGTHLSDVTLVMPLFHHGELIAFAANKAHWTDVGGKDTGTVSNDTREVFQEGLQLPCVRLFHGGELDRNVADIIASNVRLPDLALGDMQAQAASCRLAHRRVGELCEKYGVAAVRGGIDHMFAHSAELARLELAKLPAGVYEARDRIDQNEAGDGPYDIAVRVTIDSDTFRCEFLEVPDQLGHPFNCSPTGLESAVRIVFKALIAPNELLNDGGFEVLEIACDRRTLFTAERPTPTSTYWEVLCCACDLVWKAVAPAMPDRATAGHFMSVACQVVSGIHPETGELFILFEPNPGGWGAGIDKDGERGLVSIGDGETFIMPVEVTEHRYGLRIEQYAFAVEAAGAGRRRGGEGIVRDFRVLADGVAATGFLTRSDTPPWGVDGGHDGSTNEIAFLDAAGTRIGGGGMSLTHQVPKGGLIRLATGTGGGWGDPFEREPELVAADVRNEFVTVEQAAAVYGVVVEPGTCTVTGLTEERRAAAAT